MSPSPIPNVSRNARSSRIGLLGLFTLLTLSAGCQNDPAPPAPKPIPSASPPVDRLSPGELPEGQLTAFGLKLPRVMRLKFRGPDKVVAEGLVPAERVANYVRKRVKAKSVELGAARTIFDQVKIFGDKVNRPVRIEVMTDDDVTRLVVIDLTPPKLNPLLTPEQRWNRHGFDKDGKLLDPNNTM